MAKKSSMGPRGKAAGTSASGDRPTVNAAGQGGGNTYRGPSQGAKQGRAPDYRSFGRG